MQSKIQTKPMKTICDKHDEIYDLAYRIYDLYRKSSGVDLNEMENIIGSIADIADDIMTVAKDAKADGQRMEDRLKEYREAIEGLGFKRSK